MSDFNLPDDFEVCHCNGVTLGEIVTAIKEKGCKTVEDVTEACGAGGVCGDCEYKDDDTGDSEIHIDEILAKING